MTLNSHHARWLFVGCLAVAGFSGAMAVTSYVALRPPDRRFPKPHQELLQQASRDLIQAMEQRRQVPLFLRDALEKAPNLSDAERQALARSVAERAPYLLAAGAVDRAGGVTWWILPQGPPFAESGATLREALRRARWRNLLGLSSQMLVSEKSGRDLLIFLEPLRMLSGRFQNLVALFEFKSLVEDVLQQDIPSWVAIRLMEDRRVLYRSEAWPAMGPPAGTPVAERQVRFESIRWILQMVREAPSAAKPSRWWGVGTVAAVALAVLGVLGMFWAADYLGRLAMTDELTGLYNRRFFLERWAQEVERSKRYQRSLSCLLIDVNGFKQINDLAGHPTGDRVLKQIAQELKRQLRVSDILARFGGDEFIVALPEAGPAQAALVAEKLRRLSIVGAWKETFPLGPVTLSVGLAQLKAGDSPQQVIERADEDLYATRGEAVEARPIPLP